MLLNFLHTIEQIRQREEEHFLELEYDISLCFDYIWDILDKSGKESLAFILKHFNELPMQERNSYIKNLENETNKGE